MVTASVGRLRRHSAGEDRGADVAEEEGRRSDLREAQRWKVPFPGQLGKAPRLDFIDLEAGETLHLTVALLRPVIDIVVAEGPEVEGRERVKRPAPAEPAARIKPDRAV